MQAEKTAGTTEKLHRQTGLKGLLQQQSFQPSWFAALYHPFFFIRRDLFRAIRKAAPDLSGELLDFGCGRKPYRNLFLVNRYTGVDIEVTGHDHQLSQVDVYYDGKKLPFPDDSFDSLFCSEVLEHVFNPDEILPEIRRVMKPGAYGLLTTPFCWNEHEVPYDYARYSSFGMKHLMEKNGFRTVRFEKSGHFTRVIFQLWALYFYEGFKKFGLPGKLLAQLFITPINLAGIVLSFILPRNRSLYFNNVIIVQKA